jgi:hypothetical protein
LASITEAQIVAGFRGFAVLAASEVAQGLLFIRATDKINANSITNSGRHSPRATRNEELRFYFASIEKPLLENLNF